MQINGPGPQKLGLITSILNKYAFYANAAPGPRELAWVLCWQSQELPQLLLLPSEVNR